MIKRKADADGLAATVVERDYILTHTLASISRCAKHSQIVFKGGTALRLCHFEDYRYSADLDFSLVDGLGIDQALQLTERALTDCAERLGAPLLRLNDASPPRIEYVGPLDAKPRQLKLDLAVDELVGEVTTLPIIRRYEDQDADRCLVYTLDEVVAEKLRCVIQRLQCRDLFDLHRLLVVRRVDAEAAWPNFERKARHCDLDPDRFAEYFERRAPEWQRRWDAELVEYLGTFPHFDATMRAVRRELRFALK